MGDNKELKWPKKHIYSEHEALVKNRKAAQQYRDRQKQHIQDLEKQCTTLTEQNNANW